MLESDALFFVLADQQVERKELVEEGEAAAECCKDTVNPEKRKDLNRKRSMVGMVEYSKAACRP